MEKLKLGITGSRYGFNENQFDNFYDIIEKLKLTFNIIEFHHGVCKGIDEQSHFIIRDLIIDCKIIGHSPENQSFISLKAFKDLDIKYHKYPYLIRNKNIVDKVDLLIAIPNTNDEIIRSGTWSTIRYAKKKNKKIIIIYPNKIEYNN